MSGPKRNPDKLNTIGIVVVGICGAVLVYVTIVALQAFYMDDTAGAQNTADYGNQEAPLKLLKADQQRNISELGLNQGTSTYRIPIDRAMDAVVESAKVDPATLVPSIGKADKPTIQPVFGRPISLTPGAGSGAGSAAGSGAGSAATPTNGSDAGSAAGSGAGSGSAEAAGSGAGSASGSAAQNPAPAQGSGNGTGSGAAVPAPPVTAPPPRAGSNAP